MAIVFGLWIECGEERDRHQVARHFDGFTHPVLTGRTLEWRARVVGPPSYPKGVAVGSGSLSNSSVRTLQDALEATESGLRLYAHLKQGPAFRFARVGWDPETVEMAELRDFVTRSASGESALSVECVMHDSLYRALG